MAKMACRINRTESNPIDLYTLVATALIYWMFLALQMKNTCLHDLFDSNPKSMSIDDIIWTLKTKLRSLKAQWLWNPAESKKLDIEGELSVLKLAMNKLAESQKMG